MATVKTRIGPADNGRRMSLEEYLDSDFAPNYRIELARGVIEVSEVPNDPHGQIVDNVHFQFETLRRQHPGVILRIAHASEVQLIIPELDSERNPDLGVIFRGTPLNGRGRIMPRLVVEVVSLGKAARDRDYVTKAEEYLVFGILEYWIVDQFLRQVVVLIRIEEAGVPTWSERIFRDSQVIESQLLPGFAGTVADLWADAFPEDPEPQ